MEKKIIHDGIIFATQDEAEDTLAKLTEIMEEYSFVRVADLYDLAGCTCSHYHNRLKWYPEHLKEAVVRRVRDGWIIDLPDPIDVTPSYREYPRYRSYAPSSMSKPKPAPKTLTIAIDYAGVDDDFDDVLAKAIQYAQTITDREVKIDIC